MAYTATQIKNRVAQNDDYFIIKEVGKNATGETIYQLVPAPTSVTEPGTDIDKTLLQSMEDRITLLMNRVFDGMSANPFLFEFTSLNGVTATGVWNSTQKRIEC